MHLSWIIIEKTGFELKGGTGWESEDDDDRSINQRINQSINKQEGRERARKRWSRCVGLRTSM